jgi:hypothetical protein
MKDIESRSRYRIPPGEPEQLLTYAQQLAQVSAECLDEESDRRQLTPLFRLIGVAHLTNLDSDPSNWRVSPSFRTNALYEPLVQAALIQTMRFIFREGLGSEDSAKVLSVAGGLVENDRWIRCLETEDDAYLFAILLMRLSSAMQSLHMVRPYKQLRSEVSVNAGVCLIQWLKPEVPFTKIPRPADLAESMFGSAWCSVAIDPDRFDEGSYVTNVVMTQRPPFRPGLLSAALESTAFPEANLPDLGC